MSDPHEIDRWADDGGPPPAGDGITIGTVWDDPFGPEVAIRWRALGDIEAERDRQDERWGEQNHPDVFTEVQRRYAADQAASWKTANALRARDGVLAWDGILLEEVYEALAEEDPAKLRAELVQVAAVAACWVEAIDRRMESTA